MARQHRHVSWESLGREAKAFRLAHTTWSVVGIATLGYIWAMLLRRLGPSDPRRGRLLGLGSQRPGPPGLFFRNWCRHEKVWPGVTAAALEVERWDGRHIYGGRGPRVAGDLCGLIHGARGGLCGLTDGARDCQARRGSQGRT